jgi:hypothetical protein
MPFKYLLKKQINIKKSYQVTNKLKRANEEKANKLIEVK